MSLIFISNDQAIQTQQIVKIERAPAPASQAFDITLSSGPPTIRIDAVIMKVIFDAEGTGRIPVGV